MNCTSIQRMLDEADGQGNIPFEAAKHCQVCDDCRTVADQRVKLLELLNSTGRVSAPPDFNFVLMRRLRERTSVQSRRWYLTGLNLKLAGVAAALVCALALVQLMRHNSPGGVTGRQGVSAGLTTSATPSIAGSRQSVVPALEAPTTVAVAKHHRHLVAGLPGRDLVARRPMPFPLDIRQSAAAFVLLRGGNVEQEMAIRAVTIGSQPLYYQAPSSSARVSF